MSGKFFRTVLAAVLLVAALVMAVPSLAAASAGQTAPAAVLAMEHGTTGT